MKENEIIFLEHNPYMSVELLNLLTNLKILCYNDDETFHYIKQHWKIDSYLNTNFLEEPESDQAAEIMLKDGAFLDRCIHDRERAAILFFYMNERMDKAREAASLDMLLPDFQVQERLGNKIFLSEICKLLNISRNKAISFDNPSENNASIFNTCADALGIPFIVQDALGESGWDTELIHTEQDLIEARTKISHGLKAAKYIPNNIPVSVHICILDKEIIIRGPWLQLVGLPELSSDPYRFTGNDTNQSLLDEGLITQIRDMSSKIAAYMQKEGYRGICGIDYLWDKRTGIVFPQEINSRLVGLTRLLTGMQVDQSLLPDLLVHIKDFGSPILSERALQLGSGELDFSKKQYAQLIIRNNESHHVTIHSRLEPGIYRTNLGRLEKTKESLFVCDMENDEILVTSSAHTGCDLQPGEAILRLILKQSVVDAVEYKLTTDAVELINTIRAQTTSPRIDFSYEK